MCLADAEIAAAIGYAEQEKSLGTRRAYASDWRAFSAFCDARGLEAMPATPGTAARFLSLQADSGLKASTIGRAPRRSPTSTSWQGQPINVGDQPMLIELSARHHLPIQMPGRVTQHRQDHHQPDKQRQRSKHQTTGDNETP